MSEGYQRRPEEMVRWWRHPYCILLCLYLMIACNAVNLVRVISLQAENAALTKQLDYWTCRVQFDPMPGPEQIGETPTLIDGTKP